MANLLYIEYNKGCYVGWGTYDDDYTPGDYCYGYGENMVSYYADLKPNTTYTIQRIDTSSRFRIALSSQDLKMLKASSETNITYPYAWGYRADSSNPITFTTTDTATHLVVYYTNNSEYNTRVMLNEGSSIEPYEPPTMTFRMWYLDTDGRLNTTNLPVEGASSFTPPYPASFWYLDANDKLNLSLLRASIPFGAFARCEQLTEVILPESLTSIGEESFVGTALTKVTIPNDNCSYYSTSFPEGCVVTGGHLIE